MPRTAKTRFTLILVGCALAVWLPAAATAQDDPNDAPLGDVARTLRKQAQSSSQEVIDNDNISQVTEEVASHRLASAALLYSMDGAGKGFQVSAPDVTCSLAFTANAKALLSTQYAQVELPPNELLKLDGPAALDGNSLQVSVFNGTDWHVSEVAVALTIVKGAKPDLLGLGSAESLTPANPVPATDANSAQQPAARSAKKSDTTVVYRIRAAAPPGSVTAFRAPLNLEIAPGQEWHWAIVQARGYPPQPASLPAAPTTNPAAQPVPAQAQDPVGNPQPLPPQLTLEPHSSSPIR